jgi:probable rRNA maturation factor
MSRPLTLFLYKSEDSTVSDQAYTVLANRNKQLSRVFSGVVNDLNEKEINIILTSSVTMKKLNKRFRQIDKPTDILTFPLESKVFGELWLCPSEISKNAKQFEEDFEKELLRITIHGLLHLAGMDHKGHFGKKAVKTEKMFEVQEKILEMLY